MTPAEALVMVMATVLAAAAIVKGRRGTLGLGVGVLLLAVAMLAALAVVLHMLARVPG
jgi:hypothetical protein